ncbi:inovirus-type Gp2 protein [Dyella sp. A6]|uniref:YagK/YfjJ domain-containing protein n=1 Tax=Dyella aluminiiresistens TaxID=3069105 RepID=UPI002E77683D|nr:inovirus-type Gp2 protein [Dyella sp. A6]
MINFLGRLERRVIAVAGGKSGPWERTLTGRLVLSKAAKELWYSIRDVEEFAPQSLVEGRRLNPWLDVGLRLAYEWRSRLISYTDINGLLPGGHELVRAGMVEIFNAIRCACEGKAFRAAVNNHKRGAKKNYHSCANYMLSMFHDHARPLVLRVDLYFEGDGRDLSESKKAKNAFNKFMRALREGRVVPDVLRYIAKREDGLERRIHYHVLVAMNGDMHCDAFYFSELIGKFWVDQCVGSPSLASYFNVWIRRHELEYCCLGHLHYRDEHKLEGLRRAIWYLCEDGAYVLVHEVHGRNLRKGQLPKGERRHKRGRPRRDGASLALAEGILLAPVPAAGERLALPQQLIRFDGDCR